MIGKNVVGGVVVGAAVLGVLGLSVAVASSVPPASAAQATKVSAGETSAAAVILPALATPQTAADALPAYLQSGRQAFDDVDPRTSRSLGTDLSVRYWTAEGTGGQVCLIALLPGNDHVASETCGTPTDIQQKGLGLQLTKADGSVAVNAYLLPPGYTAAAPYRTVSPQLVVGDARTQFAPSVVSSDAGIGSGAKPLQLANFGLASANSR